MSRKSDNPKVVLAVKAGQDFVRQKYDQLIIVENTDNAPWPLFYNDIINKHLGYLVFCLGENIPSSYKTVSEVVDIFIKYPNAIGAMYTDTLQNIYPSYNPSILINPPLILNGGLKGKIFDDRLDHLYYFDVLRKLSGQSIIYHIPKRLIDQKSNLFPKKDMEILNICQ